MTNELSNSDALREILARDLDATELGTYDALDSIPTAVVAVVAMVGSRYRILACKYLHTRVKGADFGEVMLKVEAITDREKRRT
jgi:hypothetical protein